MCVCVCVLCLCVCVSLKNIQHAKVGVYEYSGRKILENTSSVLKLKIDTYFKVTENL